jgi:hypothetical protein
MLQNSSNFERGKIKPKPVFRKNIKKERCCLKKKLSPPPLPKFPDTACATCTLAFLQYSRGESAI